MNVPILSEELRLKACANLEERRQQLFAAKFGAELAEKFSLCELHEAGAGKIADRRFGSIENSDAIYTIAAADEATAQSIADKFPKRDDRILIGCSLPRTNLSHADSLTLYVGSSMTVRTRLKQHFGLTDSRKTYALHLKHWCHVDGSLIVRVQPVFSLTDPLARQDLEDTLWRELRPRYGRLGGR
ncbi:hypothetical protein [Rhizobium phaseoli]|uniref:hypothetical protein n=1 Tax=Rhizobium phaseoli TaxID=396 RepID=UPI0011417F8F|nr:hypothetical protein [Rhizobium phaseoli]